MQHKENQKVMQNPKVPVMKFVAILTAVVSLDLAALYFLFFLMNSNLAKFIEQIVRL